ncbi:MAG: DUF521 domain-containing protein [Lachnospiraceae bacterium]|nr:DUF521 domain-containing protein [Lachnospiraceae bacterium]
MHLTQEEQDILAGSQGEVMQKVLRTIVAFGDVFGAERLIPIEGPIHFVNTTAMAGLDAVYAHLDEIIGAGIKTLQPFTVDPYPMDFVNIETTEEQKKEFLRIYEPQDRYIEQLLKIGLKSMDDFSCACYLPQIGNIPKKGQIIAWAESSAVVYANSVLGARTNRNSALIELFCGIMGKVPEFGLLLDKNRKATWKIEVRTSEKPSATVLGSAVGRKVMEDVPYITGLEKYLGTTQDGDTQDYLKDLGAAAASNGAVGLFHVEGVTPEALDLGEELLAEGYQTYVIDDQVLADTVASYPVLWKDKKETPVLCLIGCPHLSLTQVQNWYHKIVDRLEKEGKERLAVQTIFLTPPAVIKEFKKDEAAFERLTKAGVNLSNTCPIMYMTNPLCAARPVVTCSNKARTYSTARFYEDDDLLEVIVTGDPERRNA